MPISLITCPNNLPNTAPNTNEGANTPAGIGMEIANIISMNFLYQFYELRDDYITYKITKIIRLKPTAGLSQ